MENQLNTTTTTTTGRPWFRLASLARLETMVPTPDTTGPVDTTTRATTAPIPRIPLPRSQTLQVEAQPQLSPPPETQVLQLPPPPPSPRTRVPSRDPTLPPESPRVIKPSPSPPPESPKIRQLEPVKAPPQNPEPEPKSLPSPKNGSRNDTANNRKNENEETNVITMAGENMGAYMELLGSRHTNIKQQHGYYKLQHQNKGNEYQSEAGKSESINKKDKVKKSITEGKPVMALVNSNVQSVNNSIMFRSSCTQQSPGVHLTLVSQRQPKHKDNTE